MTTKQHYEQAAQGMRGELKGAFDASNDTRPDWANDQSPDFKQKLEADAFNYGMQEGGAASIGQKARLNENMLTNKGQDTAEAREQKRKDDAAHLRRMQEISDWQARMSELFTKLDKDFDAFDKDRQEAEENERAIREGLDILKNGSTDDKRQWLADPKKGKLDPNMIANMSDADIDKAFPEEIRNKIDLHQEFMNGMKADLDKIQQDIDGIRAEYKAQGYSPEQTDEAVSKYVDRLDQSGKGLTAMQERANTYGIELAEFRNMTQSVRKEALQQGKDYDVLKRGDIEQSAPFYDLDFEQTSSENPVIKVKHETRISAAATYTDTPFAARTSHISGAFNASAEGKEVSVPQNEINTPEVEPVHFKSTATPNPFS